MSDKVYVGYKLEDLETKGEFAPYTRVVVTLDSETAYTAGTTDGRTLTVSCPWGTQEMADNILASIQGYVYTPFTGTDAILDPASELGDGCTVGLIYAPLTSVQTTLDALCAANISATADEELDHEYPYKSQVQQTVEYQIRQVKASLTVDIDSITQQITGINGELTQITADITGIKQTVQDQTGNISSLQQTATSLQSQITSADGNISTLQQTATSLQSQITDATGEITTLQQTTDSITQTVQGLNGQVTTVSTTLDGLTITTGSGSSEQTLINGSSIYTNNLYVKAANITGTLTAQALQGQRVNLINSDDEVSGYIRIAKASSADEAVRIYSYGAMAFLNREGNIYFEADDVLQLTATAEVQVNATSLLPSQSGVIDLGSSSNKWDDIYATNGTIITSDANQKADIEDISTAYFTILDNIRPVRFKLIDGQSGRYHVGFIAQEVEMAIEKAGLLSTDFAGFIKSQVDGQDIYALRYTEFIPLLLGKIQQLEKRLEALT